MELGLRSPLANVLFNVKGRIAKLFLYFDAARYFKDALNWFYIVLTISLIAIQIYFSIKSYNQLPAEVPMLSYFNQLDKRLIYRQYIFALPLVSILMLFIAGRFSYKYFHKERALTRILLLILLLSTSLITMLSLKITLPYYG